jgi:DNA (cytosine-5)-methyltransferase 1
MKVFGLFSGIGGFELAAKRHGYECVGLCDIDSGSRAVLEARFPESRLATDVTKLRSIGNVDLLTAGFPCQDLSQAGNKTGIVGSRSKLVDHVFRLVESAKRKPRLIVLENVSYMLRLNRGEAMTYILKRAEALGYMWAYRVLDARCFGLPQRRERVIVVLSRETDPANMLFPDGYTPSPADDSVGAVDLSATYGFYWTEGKRGLGWVKNAVPTIKGGSGLGIPSPPAIWNPRTHFIGTPTITDAERMFGYPANWTKHAQELTRKAGTRWSLVGNTVCVPMIDWVLDQTSNPRGLNAESTQLKSHERPPIAAFGRKGARFRVDVSPWATSKIHPKLENFLKDELKPLSYRAAAGFFDRTNASTSIRFADGFLQSVQKYLKSAA